MYLWAYERFKKQKEMLLQSGNHPENKEHEGGEESIVLHCGVWYLIFILQIMCNAYSCVSMSNICQKVS